MMLKPTMSELLEIIPNRYLLVNVAAKRARDIADAAEQAEEPLDEKPVKLALYDIMAGRVKPVEGPRQPEQEEAEAANQVAEAEQADELPQADGEGDESGGPEGEPEETAE